MIVAIDGPAGTGKSTVAKIIAQRLNITFLNSGSFYRAVTLYLIRNNIPYDDADNVVKVASGLDLDYVDSHAAVKHGFIDKRGAWFTAGEDKIGQGRENAISFLEQNKEYTAELERSIHIRQHGFGNRKVHAPVRC